MTDIQIRNLLQKYGILNLFISEYYLKRLFDFVREVEKISKEDSK